MKVRPGGLQQLGIAFAVAASLALTGCAGVGTEPTGTATGPVGASGEAARPSTSPTESPGTSGATAIDALPTQAELDRARQDADQLDTRRLAAQLVVPRRENDPAVAARLTQEVGFGGAVLFAEHVPASRDAVVSTVTRANEQISQAVAADRPWPAFIGVDQEGGPIARLGAPLTQFPSAMALGATGDASLARKVGAASGSELAALGFTVVLAPDADVTSGPDDPTIGVRSPGSDAALVARIAVGYAQGYADAGLLSAGKHFPGHGSVAGDTHVGGVRQKAGLDALMARDLLPFSDLITAGVPALMTAHIVLDSVDSKAPATLSRPVLTGLLREKLGFRGLVVTDALEMGAVTEGAGPGEAAVQAVEAGADVLLMPSDPRAAAVALTQAVDSGRLSRDRLLDSAARMIASLRHSADRATVAPVTPGQSASGGQGPHAEVAAEVAKASITQVSGACGERLIADGMVVSGGTETDRTLLRAAAREAGVALDQGTRVVLVSGAAYRAAENAAGAATEQRSRAGASGSDVTIALDVPYPLSRAPGVTLATFGRTPATFTALVDVLTGKHPAQGALPVTVGSKPVGSGCAPAR